MFGFFLFILVLYSVVDEIVAALDVAREQTREHGAEYLKNGDDQGHAGQYGQVIRGPLVQRVEATVAERRILLAGTAQVVATAAGRYEVAVLLPVARSHESATLKLHEKKGRIENSAALFSGQTSMTRV